MKGLDYNNVTTYDIACHGILSLFFCALSMTTDTWVRLIPMVGVLSTCLYLTCVSHFIGCCLQEDEKKASRVKVCSTWMSHFSFGILIIFILILTYGCINV